MGSVIHRLVAAAGVLVVTVPFVRVADLEAQAPCPARGVWVEIGGRRLYRLDSGARVPPRQSFALLVSPADVAAPVIRVRGGSGTDWRTLPAERADDGCGWRAEVASLPPLAPLEVQVTRASPLTEAQRDSVKQTLVRMLAAAADLFARGVVPDRIGVENQIAVLREQLRLRFPPATTLAHLRLPGAAAADEGLGAQLIEMASRADSVLARLGAYASRLYGLRAALTSDSALVRLQPEQREALRPLLASVGGRMRALADSGAAVVGPLFLADPPVLPLSATARAALGDLASRTWADPAGVQQALDRVAFLGVPLERSFPDLFPRLVVLTSTSYSTSAVAGTLPVGDLSRFGTVDFVAGQILRGAHANAGFLTVSFFPTGPQPRTPEADLATGGRLALTLGYSVAGRDSLAGAYLLAGLTLRVSRLASVTFGFISPEKGGRFSCCFVGAGGDLSTLPGLKDLFVRGTDGN